MPVFSSLDKHPLHQKVFFFLSGQPASICAFSHLPSEKPFSFTLLADSAVPFKQVVGDAGLETRLGGSRDGKLCIKEHSGCIVIVISVMRMHQPAERKTPPLSPLELLRS